MVERLICPFCGRDDFKRKCDLTQHANRCKMNPNRIIKIVSEETKKKLSETKKGKNNPFYGRQHTEETKKKLSEAATKRFENPEERNKISEASKRIWETPGFRENQIQTHKGKVFSDETRQKNSEAQKIAQNRPEVRQKWYNTKKQNNSFNSSKIEEQLKEYFTTNNINFKTQYKSEEYPFMCDFYFPDKDLYVEIQGTWTHGGKPFDSTNKDCIEQLELWKSKNKPFYNNAIDTWTNRDVNKRNWAKEHGLNWIEIFSDDFDECINTLRDAKILF